MTDDMEARLRDNMDAAMDALERIEASMRTTTAIILALEAAARLGADIEREAIAAWLVAEDGAKCYPGTGMATLYHAAEGIRARGGK